MKKEIDQDTVEVSIKGLTSMIISNGRLANPTDGYTKKLKELVSKRAKTEEDLEKILLLQWEGGLYWNPTIGLYMPTENLWVAFWKAAKKHKLGTKCPGVMFNNELGFPIKTEHHKDFEAFKKSSKNKFFSMVTIQNSKTPNMRPRFLKWEMDFCLTFDPAQINLDEIVTILKTMSNRIGLGCWTPSSKKPGNHGMFVFNSIHYIDPKNQQKTTIFEVKNDRMDEAA